MPFRGWVIACMCGGPVGDGVLNVSGLSGLGIQEGDIDIARSNLG